MVSPEVFLIVMWSNLERRPERYLVSFGASSRSVPDLTCSVILTVTQSHPERYTERYLVSPEFILITTLLHLEHHTDPLMVSVGASSCLARGLT